MMLRFKKLVLSLDSVPSGVVTGRERRTNGPLTGRGGSTGFRKSKPRNNTRPPQGDSEVDRPSKRNKRSHGKDGSLDDPDVKIEVKTEVEDDKPDTDSGNIGPRLIQITGIDLGMSGSGMAFASIKADPSVVAAELDWPGKPGKFGKVPSVVAMFEDNRNHPDFENGRIPSFFGFEKPDGSVYRSYYKASLGGFVGQGLFDDPILASSTAGKLVQIDHPDKNRDAVRASLKHLRKIHLDKAQALLGDILPETRFRYVFTHPAACPPQGIEELRRLVFEAGFSDEVGNRPEFLSEAHAAAMAGFIGCKAQYGSEAWQVYFKEGTLVTVIDIGALTVDLTTVRIKSNDPKLSITEATVPTGGKCGTSAIHCRLMKVFADKFGNAFSQIPDRIFEANGSFFHRCEEHLRTFDDTRPHQRYRIGLALPAGYVHRDYDEDAEEVSITSAELKGAVDATLAYSKALLSDQWSQPKKYNSTDFREEDVQTTMFCGGGSLIPYVYRELSTFCTQNGIRFMRAKDPESTVCRGAVISLQREDFFGNRLSRASFGIEVRQNGREYINWFIDKGTDLNTSQEIVIRRLAGHVYVTYGEMLNQGQSFEMPILMYEGDGANPDSINDPNVQKISSIIIASNAMSPYLRRKLTDQMKANSTEATYLAVGVSVSVDRSARLFFEAKHYRASLGKGELRLDSTVQST